VVYTFEVVPAIVLIGPADALAGLRGQLSDSPLQVFTEYQVREAVEFIATHKPDIVAIEHQFAVSPRGEALIGRVMDDPALTRCQIKILEPPSEPARERDRKKSGAGITPATATAVATPAAPAPAPAPVTSAPPNGAVPPAILDQRGTRRAERVRILSGVSVTVDGNPAELIDLSPVGAQVISKMVLRPNQRVRMQLPDAKNEGGRAVRCAALVVWASFEMPSGQGPRYRAGLKLSGGEAEAIQDFARLYRRADGSGEK